MNTYFKNIGALLNAFPTSGNSLKIPLQQVRVEIDNWQIPTQFCNLFHVKYEIFKLLLRALKIIQSVLQYLMVL